MNIAHFAVTRPVAVTMRIAALVLLGAICVTRLPVDLLPKVSVPTVAVSTQWPNVAPEEIEAQVTRPIEEAVSSATNLYQVSSSTTEGSSVVRIQFQWGTDIGQAAVEVLQLVERAVQKFPSDPTLRTPIVYKFDPTQLPILVFGVSGERDPVKLRTLLDNQISPMVESANGVASAVATGGEQRAVIVDVDPDRLRAHGLSLPDVMRRVVEENLNLPAGIAKQSNTEYTIRSLGWFTSPEEISRIPVGSFSGQLVALGDVASVRDAHPETRTYTRLDGRPSAGLIVTKQSGANTVSTAEGVFEKIERVKKLYPNLKFGIAYDQARFISQSVHDVKINALIGGTLAVLILLFFLRNIRSTLVVALSIPTSIISTFALLYVCGFTINTMSLGGLALATGLIVDDAVVVLENIFRHIERDKKDATEAAISGTNEIISAVVASTWTVMVVFLPLLLIKGQAGQMFTQFALVVIFSLAVSLLDATTVVPMLATRLIHGEAHRESLESGRRSLIGRAFARFGQWFDALDSAYRGSLRWAIHHRALTIAGAIAVSAASLLLVPQIGTELMPATDSGDFTISVKMPVGTALAKTNEAMVQVERVVMSNPNVETAFSAAGTNLTLRGTATALIPYRGSLTVRLKGNRKRSTLQVIGDLRRELARLPGVQPRLTQYDLVTNLMTGGNPNVEVDIYGNDLGTLSDIAREVMARVREVRGLENLDINWQEAMPEIQWRVDRDKALQLGISFSDIANTINTATNGSIASYYQEKGFQYPIIVQMPEATRKTVADLENMEIKPTSSENSSTGVLLSQVAQPVYGLGPSQITRQDRQRYIAVTGTPQGRSAGEIQADLQKLMSGVRLPAGYYWDWGTDQKRRAEEFSGLGLAVVLAIALIYMLLASQFESFVYPLIILLSVPLAVTGVVLGLFLTGRTFGLTAFIGLLMLVGIVVKNGILLVDYTNVLRRRGVPREEAVLTAGPTRLRPILMTASAAILGMLPLALALGKGSEVQAPMATAVIGGLTTSTLLTLVVVPTVYTVFDDIAIALAGRRRNHGR
jgi:HAE1 family hydrophobic/amphiphilic exporter-1